MSENKVTSNFPPINVRPIGNITILSGILSNIENFDSTQLKDGNHSVLGYYIEERLVAIMIPFTETDNFLKPNVQSLNFNQ